MASLTGALDFPAHALGTAALAIGWFMLGFAFYASLFAVAGSLVSRMEELQNVIVPLNLVILVSFFLAIGATSDPDSTLSVIVSIVPFSSALAMPVRISLGAATPLEIVAALVVSIGSTALLIPLGGGRDLLGSGAADRRSGEAPRRLALGVQLGRRDEGRLDAREPKHGAAMLRYGRHPAATVYDSIGEDFFIALAPGWLNLGLWEGDGSDPAEAAIAVRRLVETIADALPKGVDVLDVGNGSAAQDPVIAAVAETPAARRRSTSRCRNSWPGAAAG